MGFQENTQAKKTQLEEKSMAQFSIALKDKASNAFNKPVRKLWHIQNPEYTPNTQRLNKDCSNVQISICEAKCNVTQCGLGLLQWDKENG